MGLGNEDPGCGDSLSNFIGGKKTMISQNDMKLRFIKEITCGCLDSTNLVKSDQHERMFKATLYKIVQICLVEDVTPILGIVQREWLKENGLFIEEGKRQ